LTLESTEYITPSTWIPISVGNSDIVVCALQLVRLHVR